MRCHNALPSTRTWHLAEIKKVEFNTLGELHKPLDPHTNDGLLVLRFVLCSVNKHSEDVLFRIERDDLNRVVSLPKLFR